MSVIPAMAVSSRMLKTRTTINLPADHGCLCYYDHLRQNGRIRNSAIKDSCRALARFYWPADHIEDITRTESHYELIGVPILILENLVMGILGLVYDLMMRWVINQTIKRRDKG